MITFLLSIAALIAGYFLYGRLTEKVFRVDPNRPTPVQTMADGVDYVEIKPKRAFLIQFLNIAGTGPIFGAIAGAMWGPAAFFWIVFGCIFGGAVHDFLVGMMSVRFGGATIAELVGKTLGRFPKNFVRFFSVFLLILVGVVFIKSPSDILHDLTGWNSFIFLGIIIAYYILATVLPIDKIIGKIYPIFGITLLIMAVGIGVGMFVKGYQIPEFTFQNLHPEGKSIFPYLFISIACGAISGFHATQSPMMARCMSNERQGRQVFYGAMIAEGIVALIWAAVAMCFFGSIEALGQAGPAAVVVNQVSNGILGPIGGVLAIIGVVACPITSGDTAFRSARLAIADAFRFDQKPLKNRFLIAIPLFAVGIALCFINFDIIWRYFSWANQTLAAIALWAAVKYLADQGRNYWIALVPAAFMTVVVVCYIIVAPEGFLFLFGGMDIKVAEWIGIGIGILAAVACLSTFFAVHAKNKRILRSSASCE